MSEHIEDWLYEEDSDLYEFRCVLGDKCLMPSPYHFPSECHSVEEMEAMYAEMEDGA